MLSPRQIIEKMMLDDAMSTWLGIKVQNIEKGAVILELLVRPEMVNGFGIAHGSISYALSDSCLAFSSNSHGIKAVSVETSISHLKPVKIGDTLRTEVEELSLSKRFGVYHIKAYNQKNTLVSVFKGTVYRMEDWL